MKQIGQIFLYHWEVRLKSREAASRSLRFWWQWGCPCVIMVKCCPFWMRAVRATELSVGWKEGWKGVLPISWKWQRFGPGVKLKNTESRWEGEECLLVEVGISVDPEFLIGNKVCLFKAESGKETSTLWLSHNELQLWINIWRDSCQRY